MGLRALRICLTRPEVFRTQLRALYRASAYGKLGIMFPMVASVWEFQECRRACLSVQDELRAEGVPFAPDVELGVMIETPAAAVLSDLLAQEADFTPMQKNRPHRRGQTETGGAFGLLRLPGVEARDSGGRGRGHL